MASDKQVTPVYPPPSHSSPASPPDPSADPPASYKDSLQRKLQGTDLPDEMKAQINPTPPAPAGGSPTLTTPPLPTSVSPSLAGSPPPPASPPVTPSPVGLSTTLPSVTPPPPTTLSPAVPPTEPHPLTLDTSDTSTTPPSIPPTDNLPPDPLLPPPPFPTNPTSPPSTTSSADELAPSSGKGGIFKKLKLVLLVLALLALLTVGVMAIKNFVQKNIDPSSSGTGTSSSGPVTLTYWSLWEPEETFHKSLAEYAQQNPGVTINFVKQSHQDYRTRLMTAISKGEGPDIFRFHNTWVPMLEKELSPLDKSAYTPDEFGNTFYQIIKNDLTNSQGELVGVPLMIDGLVMYINQEVFDNAGLGAPTTWVELENVAKQLTLYDDRQRIERSGVALGTTSNVDHWSDIVAAMMLQNSVNLNDVAGSVDPVGNSLAGDALRYYISFAKTHRFWDDTLPESALAFATGKAVVFFGPSWRANEIQQINPALKFTMHSLPQLPGGQTSWATYWVEGVSSQSPNQPEAMKLLKFLSSKQSLEDMFESTSRVRIFGLPYPRLDQTDLLMAHPYLASIGSQAPYFKTWYLASNTFDNGINEEMIKYFEDAINSITAGDDVDIVLQTVTQGVTQVLTKYGIPVN